MTQKFNEEEYDGVTIDIEPDNWPDSLAGIRIGEHSFYIVDGLMKITGDPIWDISKIEIE